MKVEPRPLLRYLRYPLQHAQFRRFVLFITFFCFFNGVAAPLWNPFMLNEALMPYALINGWGLCAGVVGLVTMGIWGRLSDRFGNKPILIATVVLSSLHPLYYLFVSPERHWPILIDFISSAVVWGGFQLALFNLLLALSPPEEKEMFFAFFTAFSGIGMGVGCLVGGYLFELIPTTFILGWSLRSYDAMFLGLFAMRLFSLFLLMRVGEERAHPVSHMVIHTLQEAKDRLFSLAAVIGRER
ncbi:MAG: hypothetical protein A2Z34_06325 [Planctomycetes bacterium RBG_16_59_8]|nr:MAG: hypothetical protein A2Z34_06325 [Planctomycetes bacterium RBG_16_59_8]